MLGSGEQVRLKKFTPLVPRCQVIAVEPWILFANPHPHRDSGPPLAGFANDSTAIGPHASPPEPPIEEPSVSSRDPSEDDATTVGDGSSPLTSLIPDQDNVQETYKTQGPKDTQEVGNKAGLRSKEIRDDVAYAVGGADSEPPSGCMQYPCELDLEDAGPRPQAASSPGSGPALFAVFNAKHVITMVLSAALFLAQDKRIKGLVFAIIVTAVHSALGYLIAFAATTPPYTPRPDHEAVHGLPRPYGSHVYSCVTQGRDNKSPLWAQIGFCDHVPRWQRGLVLNYVICAETFLTPDDAVFATNQLTKAIAMWKDVGVTFKQVSRNAPATFRVVYRDLPDNGQRNVLASAFFPNNGLPESRTLSIYALAFAKDHVNHQANFLAHEIGHILGLRHEFSLETETPWWSAMYMGRSPNSVMKYYSDSSMWHVQQQDLDELQAFYDDPMTEYYKKPVYNFVAASVVYPTDSNPRYIVVKY